MFITLKDRSKMEMPAGSSAKDLADKLKLNAPHQALEPILMVKTVDLSILLQDGDHVFF